MEMAVGILVGLYFVLVVVTVLYHVTVTILMVCNVHERIKMNIRNLILQTQPQSQPLEMKNPTGDDYDTNHCATAFSMQSCAESEYQPYADEYC